MTRLLLPIVLLSSSVFAGDSTCGFSGGWPIRRSGGCDADAPVSCGVGIQPRCCPSSFECLIIAEPSGSSLAYCCPPGQDCAEETNAHSQCPVSSWNVWAYNSDGTRAWCCEEGYYGYATLAEDAVGCQPIDEDIDTRRYETVTLYSAQSLACASSSATTIESSSSVLDPLPSTTSTVLSTSTVVSSYVVSSYSTTVSSLPSTTPIPSNSTAHSTTTSSTTSTSTNTSTTTPAQGPGSNTTPAGVATLVFAAVAGSLLVTIL
ncbi:hypothetical protein NPX13_g4284 [Xylaria arbuscula]|uniref:Uncharacterized protein n=1 Tax=Xylaria arbuscula TaxID=114810 RepID=A0A9W8NGS1_9PEZI|nr:hypothetical protein NPX13_g4284 [Xylaria arbuscula]